MAAFSQDLRDRVLHGLERHEKPKAIAARLEVSVRWVQDVQTRFNRTGERHSRRVGGYRASCLLPYQADIQVWIEAKPDLTLAEISARLAEEKAVFIQGPAISTQLKRWGWRFKKKRSSSGANPTRCGAGARSLESHPA